MCVINLDANLVVNKKLVGSIAKFQTLVFKHQFGRMIGSCELRNNALAARHRVPNDVVEHVVELFKVAVRMNRCDYYKAVIVAIVHRFCGTPHTFDVRGKRWKLFTNDRRDIAAHVLATVAPHDRVD